MSRIFGTMSLLLLLPLSFQARNTIYLTSALNQVGISPVSVSKNPIDTTRKTGKLKPYSEVITTKAFTDSGLFVIHKIDSRYYFEIPCSALGRDMLIVTRISKAAADIRPANGFFGYAGDVIAENVLQFEKGPDNKLFLKRISYTERAYDSSENGMSHSVRNSNLQPIIAAFEIKAYNSDSSSIVIDMTDYINGDNSVFSFITYNRKIFPIAGIQVDKSYVSEIQSFPINIEVRTIKTYTTTDGSFATYELNSSIIMLPQEPMAMRNYDQRIGYFAAGYRDFDNPQEVKGTAMITRWRLEPRDQDIEKYQRGELAEPKKPIVYYIDPATPRKWVPYLTQGVNDWQKAFEKAGFKKAIYALEAPKNNPEWSLYDARHNAIVYKPSSIANASGPHIHDPRTGEILESHINWYHNVMELLRNWYMVQAGVNDERARQMRFNDTLMGQLIRFVCAHEVGHTLGLMHNFGASSTIPVEKLRDKQWVAVNGFCPSIMDYARFNYVAQPEDNMSVNELLPKIGMYDEWAIEWGYKWLPPFKTKEDEKKYMNHWIIQQLNKDKRYWYGEQPLFGPLQDLRCQSEDLGDNAMKAGYFGILNLKRLMPQLINWTRESNTDYTSLELIRKEVVVQYQRYLNHVINNITLPMWTSKTTEQEGEVLSYPSSEKLHAAVEFLQKELFDTPYWLMDNKIYSLIGGPGILEPIKLQEPGLKKLISVNTYSNLSVNKVSAAGNNRYSFDQLLGELETGIWKELIKYQPIDFYRRNLQRAYVDRLIAGSTFDGAPGDFSLAIRERINKLNNRIELAMPGYKDKTSKMHLIYIKDKLKVALDPKVAKPKTPEGVGISAFNSNERSGEKSDKYYVPRTISDCYLNCWRYNSNTDQ